MYALEVRHNQFIGPDHIDEEFSYELQPLVWHPILLHQHLHLQYKNIFFPHLTSVTAITTSLLDICATITLHGTGVREVSVYLLEVS